MIKYFIEKASYWLLVFAIWAQVLSSYFILWERIDNWIFVKILISLFIFLFHLQVVSDYRDLKVNVENGRSIQKKQFILKILIVLAQVLFFWSLIYNFIYTWLISSSILFLWWVYSLLSLNQFYFNSFKKDSFLDYMLKSLILFFLQFYIYFSIDSWFTFSNFSIYLHLLLVLLISLLLDVTIKKYLKYAKQENYSYLEKISYKWNLFFLNGLVLWIFLVVSLLLMSKWESIFTHIYYLLLLILLLWSILVNFFLKKKIFKNLLIAFSLLFYFSSNLIFLSLLKPTTTWVWSVGHRILPNAQIDWDMVKIYNVRNFKHISKTSAEPYYSIKTYDLNLIKSIDFILVPFGPWGFAAHIMLSFWFENWDYIWLSVETRRRSWESYSFFKWLFRQFEVIYLLWNERDLVKLRSDFQKDDVYIYPILMSKDKIRKIFLDVINRVNTLYKSPEFYDTISNNCTTNLRNHVNLITPNQIDWGIWLILPWNSDKYLYDLWLIDTDMEFHAIRDYYRINKLSSKYWEDKDYSLKIRTYLNKQ